MNNWPDDTLFEQVRRLVPPIQEEPEFVTSFLGAKVRRSFVPETACPPGSYRPETAEDERLEWAAILTAVMQSGTRFSFMDLGAGYGWWTVNAAAALHLLRPDSLGDFLAVEAEPTHFEWMVATFADNPYPNARFVPVGAAIGAESGRDWFYVGKSKEWYGQRLLLDYHRALLVKQSQEELWKEGDRVLTADGYELSPIEVRPLAEMIGAVQTPVDLIDMDIQGSEADIVRGSVEELDAKVKRIYIATHSAAIEEEVRDLLGRAGWRLIWDFPGGSQYDSPGRLVKFGDGVQFWENPSLT